MLPCRASPLPSWQGRHGLGTLQCERVFSRVNRSAEALGHCQEGPRHGPELASLVRDWSAAEWFRFERTLFEDPLHHGALCAPPPVSRSELQASAKQSMLATCRKPRLIPEGHSAFIYTLLGQVLVADVTADANHCLVLSAAPGEDGTVAAPEFFVRQCHSGWVSFVSWRKVLPFARDLPKLPSSSVRPSLCANRSCGRDPLPFGS